jgi:HAD superfamily hydrolase (TIGR01459 family)
MSAAAIPILSSIGGLASGSDAWIVDIWGVMHNGIQAHAAACDACRGFRAQGGTVVLLSNAPRPFTAVMHHLDGLGVPREAYDLGVTSGDVTRSMIEDMARSGQAKSLLHIGPERDKGLFAGLDVAFASAEAAEVAVCSGLFDDTKETPADYTQLFITLLARGVPMICANPDRVVERGEKLVYCAGALAAEYETMGGKATYAGKPFLPVYERTLADLARFRGRPIARERILAIGDGIETDLKGAHAAGLRSVFISSAVHVPGGLNASVLDQLFGPRDFAPVAALPALAW